MSNESYDDFSIIEALSLLTPYDVDKTKERIGPPRDGGYIFLSELLHRQPIFSYGIDGEYHFDLQMAERGHQMFMFDHTIDGINNPHGDPKLHWVKEGVDGVKRPDQLLDTIENHVARFAPDGRDMILKMDVEGYEYDAFDATPIETLLQFSQISFEIHFLHDLVDANFRRRFVRVMSKLTRYFTLFHVHANNYDGEVTYTFLSGVPVSNLLELSFVRSDLVARRSNTTLYPTPLDYPNVHPRDKKLWFFPFLPVHASCDFVGADRRLEKQVEGN